MPRRVIAAKYINSRLPEPYETQLGGEPAHKVLNTGHAHWATPPRHSISWRDCYAAADGLPLPQKARLFLDQSGYPLPVPAHLVGSERTQTEEAVRLAVKIGREARHLDVDN
ncbi:hypothetical protein [Streptomyces rimosus]|uniref:hypothetical protein n=1 Tax=Streptomyces rimosus TaxID=1927 RepID=UPI0009964EAD|nr:hypothetical protein [Streptomyces rimosus]